MHLRQFAIATCIALAASQASTGKPVPSRSLTSLFHQLQPLTSELARYKHLVIALPLLDETDQLTARQLFAACENELGLYSEAVRDFPLRSRLPDALPLPDSRQWEAVDAVEAISELSADRRIVMVNEAHHDAHTRELTLQLLPRLRARGFKYFAAEALDERDDSAARLGYPVTTSGSEYLHEPVYGEIVREALRLGYVIVAYDDTSGGTPQQRENRQAENLYHEVFRNDPTARLFVHAGYAHIDKRRGRLGSVRPMAIELQRLTGLEPLSIDQTDIRETPRSEAEAHQSLQQALHKAEAMLHPMHPELRSGPGSRPRRVDMDSYDRIIATFQPSRPIVLRRIGDQAPWSARPGIYDINVILPPANSHASAYLHGPLQVEIEGHRHAVMPPASRGHRPDWLTLGGTRTPVPVDSNHCAGSFPCLVEAHYANEPDKAIAADRYLFLQDGKNVLYLRPGRYRLRSINGHEQIVDEHPILAGHPALE